MKRQTDNTTPGGGGAFLSKYVAEKLILVLVNPDLMLCNTKINRSSGTANSLIDVNRKQVARNDLSSKRGGAVRFHTLKLFTKENLSCSDCFGILGSIS